MKKLFSIALLATVLMMGVQSKAQMKEPEDKSKRPSPPAMVTKQINTGATITIDYSQPSVKGRTIGKDLEPMDNKVWRTGANEATVFTTDKDVKVAGEKLPAGKYGLFTIFNGDMVTVIFNKTSKQWGAFNYKEADDILRIHTKTAVQSPSMEKMTFMIADDGVVTLAWGDRKFSFKVQ